MPYLLDTGVLTAYLQQRPAIKALVDPWVQQGQATTSLLVYGEIVEYFHSLPNAPLRINQLRALVQVLGAHSLTLAIEDRYATIRRALGDFQRVPGLQLMHIPRSQLRA